MELPVVIEPRRGLFHLRLGSLWEFRELLYFLVWRDVKVRYKQTAIGIGWAVFQPLMSMAIFTVIFGMFARLPSEGIPYPLFAYTAILPWNYFASSLERSTRSIVGDSHLITKVYFPRLLLPMSATVSGLVDFGVSFVLLLGLMAWYGVPVTWSVLYVPAMLLFALATALGVGLWLSALYVRYRDIGHAVPFIIQLWLFLSPVVYNISLVPERYRLAYSLNPMVGVIQGFRWGLLGAAGPDRTAVLISAAMVAIILAGGVVFFRNSESRFADVV